MSSQPESVIVLTAVFYISLSARDELRAANLNPASFVVRLPEPSYIYIVGDSSLAKCPYIPLACT
jgi:hypothetical protein